MVIGSSLPRSFNGRRINMSADSIFGLIIILFLIFSGGFAGVMIVVVLAIAGVIMETVGDGWAFIFIIVAFILIYIASRD